MPAPGSTVLVRHLGRVDYGDTLAAMRRFTESRLDRTDDEIWVLEHEPVFTLGQAGRREHLLATGDVPVVQSDRGGQVTYHGPGQIVAYLLFDIRRRGITVRDLVVGIERAVIGLLKEFAIVGESRRDAPGVYVEGRKIAALGLRVKKGRCYHGLSLNVDMDLEPFTRINPCGYEGLEVTQLRSLGVDEDGSAVAARLVNQLAVQFGYDVSGGRDGKG